MPLTSSSHFFPLKNRFKLRVIGVFSAAILAVLANSTQAETTSNSGAQLIPLSSSTSFTYTINSPGTWYLQQDYTVSLQSGAFITVGVSNVTIDFNGHTITNTYGVNTSAYGVACQDKANITVRNGNVNGFYTGVNLISTIVNNPATALGYGQLVEDMCFTKCIFGGVMINGVGNRIHRCRCVLMVGHPSINVAFGFDTVGLNNTIENCDAMGTTCTGTTYGIIVGLQSGTGNSFAVNNRVSGVTNGVYLQDTSDKYRDTLTAAVTRACHELGMR